MRDVLVIYPRCANCGKGRGKHGGEGGLRCPVGGGIATGRYYSTTCVYVPKRPLSSVRTATPKRTTRIKAKSARPLPKVRTSTWDLFAAYVKQRDGNVCFSCGKAGLEGRGWHAGHMFPSGNNSVIRYEPKNVHSQCGRCNCFLGGNGAAYVSRFLDVYGVEEFRRLSGLRGTEKKWTRPELEEMSAALKRGGADFECWYAERYGLASVVQSLRAEAETRGIQA
jgi:hypothetical protein